MLAFEPAPALQCDLDLWAASRFQSCGDGGCDSLQAAPAQCHLWSLDFLAPPSLVYSENQDKALKRSLNYYDYTLFFGIVSGACLSNRRLYYTSFSLLLAFHLFKELKYVLTVNLSHNLVKYVSIITY